MINRKVPIDWSRPIQTQDGRSAKLLTTDSGDPIFPVIATVTDHLCGRVIPHTYTLTGDLWQTRDDSSVDLINVPPKIEKVTRQVFVILNKNGYPAVGTQSSVLNERETAESVAGCVTHSERPCTVVPATLTYEHEVPAT